MGLDFSSPQNESRVDFRLGADAKGLRFAAYMQAHNPNASSEQVIADFRAQGGGAALLEFSAPVKELYLKSYKAVGSVTCCCGKETAFEVPIVSNKGMGVSWGGKFCPSCYEEMSFFSSGNGHGLPLGDEAYLIWAYYYPSDPARAGVLVIFVREVIQKCGGFEWKH